MPTRQRSAFTLLELMISIALALLLVLGINAVFSMTAKTVGAAELLSQDYRDARAGVTVISADFQGAAPMSSTPCLVLESRYVYAFVNPSDYNGDSDKVANTFDNQGSSTPVPAALWGRRSKRSDRVGFFARGLFSRQTGTNAAMIDTVTSANGTLVPFSSNEAWIVYGHLNVGVSPGAGTFPGVGTLATNADNFYSAQWILGRSCTLLSPNPQGNSTTTPQFYRGTSGLAPLAYGSTSGDGHVIDNSRYDVAQTSISTFYQQMVTYIAGGSNVNYWDPMVSNPNNRYCGFPYAASTTGTTKTFNSTTASQVVPCFLAGCSSFAVEYTGDFVTQNAAGQVTAAVPDGIPDFQLVGTGSTSVRKTRWYGLPRDTNGDGVIDPAIDVVTLRDACGAQQPFERVLPTPCNSPQNNYGSFSATVGDTSTPGDRYVVAWGPDTEVPQASTGSPCPTPTMLRLVFTLDNMSDRLGTGQTFEVIVALPQ